MCFLHYCPTLALQPFIGWRSVTPAACQKMQLSPHNHCNVEHCHLFHTSKAVHVSHSSPVRRVTVKPLWSWSLWWSYCFVKALNWWTLLLYLASLLVVDLWDIICQLYQRHFRHKDFNKKSNWAFPYTYYNSWHSPNDKQAVSICF